MIRDQTLSQLKLALTEGSDQSILATMALATVQGANNDPFLAVLMTMYGHYHALEERPVSREDAKILADATKVLVDEYLIRLQESEIETITSTETPH